MMIAETLIIGAGPIGIELAVALQRLGHAYIHLEAKQIGHTISWFPRQVRLFSSADRIAIAGVPLHSADQSKTTREQYLAYLRAIVEQFDLDIRTYERVTDIKKQYDVFTVTSDKQVYQAKHVVLAIGDMHRPRLLHIDGENLEHVSHYFDEPHRYFRRKLLIVGGKNSAVEAAIQCHSAGAQVAISYRREQFNGDSVKYWLLPEIQMLIQTQRITFHPQTTPTAITPTHVRLQRADASQWQVEADFVLLLIGYEMDRSLLDIAGVKLVGENGAPKLDHKTMQTNVGGIYVAGTAVAGTQRKFKLFIENCHPHVAKIVTAITGRQVPFGAADKTHSGRYGLPES